MTVKCDLIVELLPINSKMINFNFRSQIRLKKLTSQSINKSVSQLVNQLVKLEIKSSIQLDQKERIKVAVS